MKKKRKQRQPNYRLVKKHHSYTVDDAARLFGCHRNTIRNWQRQGLAAIDRSRPAVFDGETLATFVQSRRSGRKQPLKAGQIFCLPCRSPKEPAGDIVEYLPLTATKGNLRGICRSCNRLIHRAVSRDGIGAASGKLEVIITEASARIIETGSPSVNCDLDKAGEP
jgi:hypothetical protein